MIAVINYYYFFLPNRDLILFKNNSEPEKVSLEILKAESEKGKEHLPSSKTNISEPTIVIRTRFDKPF